jgi:hypothetical protein
MRSWVIDSEEGKDKGKDCFWQAERVKSAFLQSPK